MAERSIVWRRAETETVLRSPAGLVGQYLTRVGTQVTNEAKSLAAEKLQRRSGRYAGGFSSTTERDGKELRMRVTNSAPWAKWIEAGTRPHIIRPRKIGGVLVFEVRGQTVFAREVHHPGTRAYRIMETALRRVIGRDR